MNVDTELNWVGPGLMLNVLLLWLKMGLMNHVVLVSFLVKVRVKQVLTLCFFRFLLPSVGVVKEGFLDSSEPHLGQLSNHLYNCVLDT